MDIIKGEFYQENCRLHKVASGNWFNTEGYRVYEVIRTLQGVLLFLEDHLERMYSGLKASGYNKIPEVSEMRECLLKLLSAHGDMSGNIKVMCKIDDDKPCFAAYYIPHFYPSEDMYRSGVKLISYQVERPDPALKQVSISERIRAQFEHLRDKENAFEVVLTDRNFNITECSKSNLFFIKRNKLYSAPEEKILKGITRKYVVNVAVQNNIEIISEPIPYINLKKFNSAFLCGTSPKVLPVKSIDHFAFNVENKITRTIASGFEDSINEYLKVHKRN